MGIQTQRHTDELVTRVEFSLSDPSYPFVGVSQLDGARVMLEEMVPRGNGTFSEFFSVVGVDPDRVLDLASDHSRADPTLLNTYDGGALFEFLVEDDCPAVFLGRKNALPREVFSVDGDGHVAAEIPAATDPADVVNPFLEAHPDATLELKRTQPYVTPLFGQRQFRQTASDTLSDRQAEILELANETGYYEWPRESTAAELADRAEVSEPTLHKHLRAAEQAVVEALFDMQDAS